MTAVSGFTTGSMIENFKMERSGYYDSEPRLSCNYIYICIYVVNSMRGLQARSSRTSQGCGVVATSRQNLPVAIRNLREIVPQCVQAVL